MKNYRANSFASIAVLRTCAALVFLFASAVSLRAQAITTPRLSSTAAGSEARAREIIDRNQRQREWNLRHLGDPITTSEEDKRMMRLQQQLIIEQVKKDYRLIQELNNEVMHKTAVAPDAFDYRQIAHHTGEINRRAARLKQYLALPRLDPDQQNASTYVPPASHETRAWLALLDTRIASFVANPFFKNLSVVDAELSAKASRDLRDIIELSNTIKRNAERLHKTAKN